MIPLRLELKNFLSYGEQAPVLNLEQIHVACLSGQNGHGKSALLDAMVWAVWGEPRGGARSGDDLIRHGAREMVVSLEFEAAGTRYRVTRSRLNRGKTFTGSLHFEALAGEQWRSLDGVSVSDTQKAISGTLHMDHDTFVHASFIAQGRADAFMALTPIQRKQVLGDILDLAQYDLYSEEARAEARAAQGRANEVNAEIQAIERDLASRPEWREKRSVAERDEREASLLVDRLTAERTALQSELHRLEDVERQVRDLQESKRRVGDRLSSIGGQIQQLEAQLAATRATLAHATEIEERAAELEGLDLQERELASRFQDWCDAREALQVAEAVIQQEQVQIEAELKSARQLVVQLQSRLPRSSELEAERDRLSDQLQALQEIETQRVHLLVGLDDTRGRLAVLKDDGQRMREAVDNQKERIRLLGESEVCPLCGQVLGPEGLAATQRQLHTELAEAEQALTHARSEYARIDRDAKAVELQTTQLDSKLSVRGDLERKLGQVLAQVTSLAQEQRRLEEVTRTEHGLATRLAAQDFAAEEQSRLPLLRGAVAEVGYDANEHRRVRQARDALRGAADQLRDLATARATLQSGEAHLESLITQRVEADEERKRLDRQLEELTASAGEGERVRSEILAKERELQSAAIVQRAASQRLGEARQMVAWLDEREAEKQRKLPLRDDALRDVAAYTQLAEAFGKNGIQEMIVDEALPEIEDFANDLLRRLSNGRMHVSLTTQRTGRTGAVISTLDVNVSDELGTRPYELFSGGEKFRINFAIRIALSRLLAHRAGAPLQLLAIDEGFGSQDREGVDRLIEAIRTVQDDFERILVITHLEEIKDAFPVRIEVVKTPEGSTFTYT